MPLPTEPIGSIPRPAGEPDRTRVLEIIRRHLRPEQRVFVGVVAPIAPRIETPEEVRDRVLEAARYIPIEQLGTSLASHALGVS
jgi:5-methyltetrahydropteroyltriglutamate--homocysteine methyltransferase